MDHPCAWRKNISVSHDEIHFSVSQPVRSLAALNVLLILFSFLSRAKLLETKR